MSEEFSVGVDVGKGVVLKDPTKRTLEATAKYCLKADSHQFNQRGGNSISGDTSSWIIPSFDNNNKKEN